MLEDVPVSSLKRQTGGSGKRRLKGAHSQTLPVRSAQIFTRRLARNYFTHCTRNLHQHMRDRCRTETLSSACGFTYSFVYGHDNGPQVPSALELTATTPDSTTAASHRFIGEGDSLHPSAPPTCTLMVKTTHACHRKEQQKR